MITVFCLLQPWNKVQKLQVHFLSTSMNENIIDTIFTHHNNTIFMHHNITIFIHHNKMHSTLH